MIWRTKMQARVQGKLQLKDSICYKWVQLGSYKFGPWNPTKKESSWFEEPRCKLGSKASSNSRIQFATNESNFVRTNLDPGTQLKCSCTTIIKRSCLLIGVSSVRVLTPSKHWSAQPSVDDAKLTITNANIMLLDLVLISNFWTLFSIQNYNNDSIM
jgi:hypothetical protein